MRIALVNDMIMAVEAMRRVILAGSDHQIAWVAKDGAEAVRFCAEDRPDLILMDLIMPKVDGVEATRRIMAASPCPIVVVTASVEDNSSKVFEAMGAGALDAVNTPVLNSPDALSRSPLLGKIETIHRLIGGKTLRKPARTPEPLLAPMSSGQECLIAIGASAGGPAAIASVLSHMPADLPASIIVVQHVDAQFVQGLADWLGFQTHLRVRLAQHGDAPEPGTVLLAGREEHLVFAGPRRLIYTREPTDCSYHPCIDVFFKSAARFWPGQIIGVVLTGMGRDGAEGLRALRRSRHQTIAQDAETSAVYGMPKAAAELDAAASILPLERIAPRIITLMTQSGKIHV
jgi:two-component system response regulator WspF